MAAKQTNALANTQTPKSLRNTPRLPPQQTAAELPRRTLLYKGDSAVTIGARAVALGMTAVMPSTAFLHQLMHVRIEDLQSSEWLVRLYQWMHVFNEEHLGFTIRESVPLSHLITYPSAGLAISGALAYIAFKISSGVVIRMEFEPPQSDHINNQQVHPHIKYALSKVLSEKRERLPTSVGELAPSLLNRFHQQLIDFVQQGTLVMQTPRSIWSLYRSNVVHVPIKELRKVNSGFLDDQKFMRNVAWVQSHHGVKKTRQFLVDWESLELQQPGMWYLLNCVIPWTQYDTSHKPKE